MFARQINSYLHFGRTQFAPTGFKFKFEQTDKSQFDLQILICRGDPLRHLTVPPLPKGEALRGSSFGGAVSEADWEGPLNPNLSFKFQFVGELKIKFILVEAEVFRSNPFVIKKTLANHHLQHK